MYVSFAAEDLQSTENIQQRLNSVVAEIRAKGVPQLVLAHSFGCIFAIYSLAEFQNPGIQFVCIDPTTHFTRGYAEHISKPLAEFLDCKPSLQLNSVHVISYRPKDPITEKKQNYIRKRHAAILTLFSDTTTVTVRKTPNGGSIADTVYTITLTGTDTIISKYDASVNYGAGDRIHVLVAYTGGGGNTTADLSVQLDLF